MWFIYYNVYVNQRVPRRKSSAPRWGQRYLHAVDVDPAHAAAAVHEEDEFAVHLPQVRADGLEVGTKVQHDHGVVQDVLVEAPVNDVHLPKEKGVTDRGLDPMRQQGDSLWICEGFNLSLKEEKERNDTKETSNRGDRRSISILVDVREIPGRVWCAFGVFP